MAIDTYIHNISLYVVNLILFILKNDNLFCKITILSWVFNFLKEIAKL